MPGSLARSRSSTRAQEPTSRSVIAGIIALLPGDLSDAGVCADVVERAIAKLGGLDTLIALERPIRINLTHALRRLSLRDIRVRSLAALPR
jgi:hypothetical protein